ncbi:hypothetical protein [Roseateles sp. BYS87W]|uniref:Pyridine nucleotide-disulfide oxidoreductase n=1 Tax=Pelomonas baiyunensis TaxID=3299026 RepID=A0ABW7H1V1_9BURK
MITTPSTASLGRTTRRSLRARGEAWISAAIGMTVAAAWVVVQVAGLQATDDLGYALGIAGGVAMLLLFAYPLRKRVRALQQLGSAKPWFVVHMVLGVAGPVLILLHSGFRIGSLNAGVALWSMLIVAGSGVVGRFLYLLTHRGLHGEREELGRLLQGLGLAEARGDSVWGDTPTVTAPLHRFVTDARDLAARPGHDLRGHFTAFVVLPWRQHRELREVRKALRALTRAGDRTHTLADLRDAYAGALRVAQFGRATRLFELWHVLHVPFVYLMVVCAVVHIVAVHVY